jgi:hypothetical protein
VYARKAGVEVVDKERACHVVSAGAYPLLHSPSSTLSSIMSRRDVEAGAYGALNGADDDALLPTRSIHALSRPEIARGAANRLVHSRAYVLLYLAMALASGATVLLSLRTKKGRCPPPLFYVLEIVVNVAMVAEVGVRVLAFGRVRPVLAGGAGCLTHGRSGSGRRR